MQNLSSNPISSSSIPICHSADVLDIDFNYLRAVLSNKFPELGYLEDIIQEAAIKIWTKKYMYDPTKSAFNTWCVTIGLNVCIDNLRKESANTRGIQSLKNTTVFSTTTELKPETIGIMTLVNNLDESEKTVIDLAYYKGYTHQEISEYMHIPLGTVKTRMTRAINNLRKYFVDKNQN